MDKLNVFIKDTFTKIIKSVSFIMMLLSPLLVIGIIFVIGYFASEYEKNVDEASVAVISDDSTIEELLSAGDTRLDVVADVQTEEEARKEMEQEDLDGYLIANWTEGQLETSFVHNSQLDSHIPIIEELLTNNQKQMRAQELGLSGEELKSIEEPVLLNTQTVTVEKGKITEKDDLEQIIQVGSAYFINIFILMFIMFYASTVIEEVAGEKGTRMMEVILSSTTATTHFFGKLIGVFLVMLVHIFVYAIIGTGAYMYFKDYAFIRSLIGDLDVGSIIVNFLEFSSVFLLIGVLMYMFIAAFLGSLITKTEDINRAATPLSLMTVLGFYIGMFAMASPENIVVTVSSFIPLLTPFVMPFRIATGTVSNLHIWLSIGGAFLFTGVLAYVALIFYRANVLIYSDTNIINTLKQSWALVRSENKKDL